MTKTVAVISDYSGPILLKLRELLPSARLVEVQPEDPTPLKDAEIIVGDYDLVGPHLYELPKVKWIQGTWAGLDTLWPHIEKGSPPKFPIARCSGENFGTLMGEYLVGNIVFWERNYFKVKDNQNERIWDNKACPQSHRTIADLKIGILGIGCIGNLIGRTLKYLGANIYGFGRRETIPLDSKEYNHISKYFTKSNLSELLGDIDYIVNILPNTSETTNLLGNRILQNCKNKNVVFINIGRGSIIKEAELVQALKEKWLSGAILDVFETEPLPKSSCLWGFPNVFITPHIAGISRGQDIAKIFKINFDRYERNEPLINQIDFEKGGYIDIKMVKSVAVFSKFPTLVEKLSDILPQVNFIKVDASDLSPLRDAEIIVGDCPLMAPHLYALPKAKWVQATSAGIDALLGHIKKEAPPPPFQYTRLSGENFGPLMGEYVFTQIVNRERQYFKVKENQKQKIWGRGHVPVSYRSIRDLKIGILGIGAIGNRSKILKYLGATIYGFGRRETIPLETEEYQHLTAYYNKNTLAQLLASVDYFVNILLKNGHTNNILGNGILKNCQGKDVVFINIGRGNVIKEVELVEALKENWISGAILDVFETEPLPQESLLWELPNVVITPHISGNSREQDIAAKFKKNFEKFENNEPLIDQIDYVLGY